MCLVTFEIGKVEASSRAKFLGGFGHGDVCELYNGKKGTLLLSQKFFKQGKGRAVKEALCGVSIINR